MMRVSSTASEKRPGSLASPGASRPTTAGMNSKGEREQHDLGRQHQREDAVGEQAHRGNAVLLADARIGRHESGVEGAFGEDRAEMIGQPQRDEEGVRDRPGAQHRGEHDVAHEAGEARQQRQAADGRDPADHAAVAGSR